MTQGLESADVQRYSRQLILPRWSARLQQALTSARIAVSAELSEAALYLVGLGVRNLTIVGDPAGAKLLGHVSQLDSRSLLKPLHAEARPHVGIIMEQHTDELGAVPLRLICSPSGTTARIVRAEQSVQTLELPPEIFSQDNAPLGVWAVAALCRMVLEDDTILS